jgi:hypothetical protein
VRAFVGACVVDTRDRLRVLTCMWRVCHAPVMAGECDVPRAACASLTMRTRQVLAAHNHQQRVAGVGVRQPGDLRARARCAGTRACLVTSHLLTCARACLQSFRSPEEAIELANNTFFGLAGSVWTENLSLALETAISIKAGAIWINAHNLFDAAAGFGGYRESGFGRDGGKEGLYEYVKPAWQPRARPTSVKFPVEEIKWASVPPGRPRACDVRCRSVCDQRACFCERSGGRC